MTTQDELRERALLALDLATNTRASADNIVGTSVAIDAMLAFRAEGAAEAIEAAACALTSKHSGWRNDWVAEACGIVRAIQRAPAPAQEHGGVAQEIMPNLERADAARKSTETSDVAGSSPAPTTTTPQGAPFPHRCANPAWADSDALAIARFLWPEHAPWTIATPDPLPDPIAMSRKLWFDHRRLEDDRFVACYGVATAESTTVSRGLAEEYGMHLASEVLCVDVSVHFDAPGVPRFALHSGVRLNTRDVARIRTAPLPTIVRALAAVARRNQK